MKATNVSCTLSSLSMKTIQLMANLFILIVFDLLNQMNQMNKFFYKTFRKNKVSTIRLMISQKHSMPSQKIK